MNFKKISVLLVIIVIFILSWFKINRLKSASVVSPSGRLNIVVYGDNVAWLLAMETQGERSIYGVMIPGEVNIETARGAGKYPTGKLAKLGELEGDLRPFIRESFERFMQVPVDGVIMVARVGKTEDLKTVFGLQDIVNVQEQVTDLGTWDRFIVWRTLQGIVLAKDNIIDISQTRAVQEKLQPDGTAVLTAEAALLPIKMRQFFTEPQLADEKQNVVVFNAANTAGLAQIVAEIIESMGINVVKLDNAEQVLAKCEIRGEKEVGETKSYARLRQVFGCDVSSLELQQEIGEIEIYVGKEFSGKMFGR